MVHKILKSGVGGGLTALVYFYLANVLDDKYSPKIANLIALLVSIALNFVVQYRVFLSSSTSVNEIHLYKFLFVVSITFTINQIMFGYLTNNKTKFINYIPIRLQKYYNTIVRMVINSVIFITIAYPTRTYWIFK